jgi:hypothetical protein
VTFFIKDFDVSFVLSKSPTRAQAGWGFSISRVAPVAHLLLLLNEAFMQCGAVKLVD